MRKLTVFNHVSLDGYIADADGDMSWAHKSDPEWNKFAASNAKGGGELVFGRVTYDQMAGWWPTPQAMKALPAVATQMNALPKIVFSRSMTEATWENTQLIKSNPVAAMRRLKKKAGRDLVIFGSGSIVALMTDARLIDAYDLVVNPIVLGSGKPLFDDVHKLPLKLRKTRSFKNGNVVLSYEL
jgi:dihydrofolate reductase